MNVLVCGANGFIGAALCDALKRDGHRVYKGVRHAAHEDDVEVDYTIDVIPERWLARLHRIDVVVNAIGILIEHGQQTFDLIHRRAPIALFDACRLAGVKRIVQISALGAQTGATPYFASKRAADEALLASQVAHHVLRPALVYGPKGASSRFFRAVAALPVHPLPAGGHQMLRPIHVDELAQIVARLATGSGNHEPMLDLVGATEVEYRQMLTTYRASMALPRAIQVPIPALAIDACANLLDRVPRSMLTRDTWHMLQLGSTADVAATAVAFGHSPAGIETFIGADADLLRHEALAFWRPALLRGALAVTWIGTAICSALIYPRAASLALLARLHLQGSAALVALYLASALDLVLGVATLVRPGRRLWAAQAGVVLAYSLVVAAALPEFLAHPFGPLLKNVPIVAMLGVLFSEEMRS